MAAVPQLQQRTLDDGWLAKPLAQLQRAEVGLVGATGSYEGTASSLPRGCCGGGR